MPENAIQPFWKQCSKHNHGPYSAVICSFDDMLIKETLPPAKQSPPKRCECFPFPELAPLVIRLQLLVVNVFFNINDLLVIWQPDSTKNKSAYRMCESKE